MLPRRWGRKRTRRAEIHPDEILIDSSNLPQFDTDQMEGRIERPLGRRSFVAAGVVLGLACAGLLLRAGDLQIAHGATYATQALENQLAQTPIFADRGAIVDRRETPLAWNKRGFATDDFSTGMYTTLSGLAHAVGYVKPPAKDSAGYYYRDRFVGIAGAEEAYDAQ